MFNVSELLGRESCKLVFREIARLYIVFISNSSHRQNILNIYKTMNKHSAVNSTLLYEIYNTKNGYEYCKLLCDFHLLYKSCEYPEIRESLSNFMQYYNITIDFNVFSRIVRDGAEQSKNHGTPIRIDNINEMLNQTAFSMY